MYIDNTIKLALQLNITDFYLAPDSKPQTDAVFSIADNRAGKL